MLNFLDNHFEYLIYFFLIVFIFCLFFPLIKGDKIKVDKLYLFGDSVEFIYNNKRYRVSFSSIELTSLKFSYFYFPRSVFGISLKPVLYLCIEDYEKLYGEIK